MDNAMQVFSSDEFGEVRTVQDDGKVLFCGSDVAKALGYAKPNNAVNMHCKGATPKRGIIDSLGREQSVVFITEGDVYRLIASSKLKTAQRFEAWVFDDVLPSIRRDGGYMLSQPDETPEQTMARAVLIATATIERQKSQLLGATAKIAKLEPKAAYADSIFDDTKSMSMTEAARQLYQLDGHMTCADLYALMRVREMICKGSKAPTKQAIEQGLLVQRKGTYAGGTKTYEAYSRVTMKGLKWMSEHFCAQQVLSMDDTLEACNAD